MVFAVANRVKMEAATAAMTTTASDSCSRVSVQEDEKMSRAKDEGNSGDSKQLLNSVREETADGFQDAKDVDAGFVTEVMAKEEEELYQALLKAEEEEEAKKREAQKAFDPNARFGKQDEMLTCSLTKFIFLFTGFCEY